MTVTTDVLYRLMVQSVSNYAIYMLDRDGIVLNWNSGAERTKGYTASEIVGRSFEAFYLAEDRFAGLPRRNLATAEREGRLVTEGWRLRRDGTAYWASVTLDTVEDASGRCIGFAKVIRDLTAQHALLVRLEHQANHDAATGLLNRSGLFSRIDKDLAAFAALALHCIDLDNFKAVNDALGHPIGDAVLGETAQRLQRLIAGSGYAGRLGGDELVVVQTPVVDAEAIQALAAAIVSTLRAPIAVDGATVTVHASVGIAQAPMGGTDLRTLLRRADAALYRAKRVGGDRAVFSDEA